MRELGLSVGSAGPKTQQGRLQPVGPWSNLGPQLIAGGRTRHSAKKVYAFLIGFQGILLPSAKSLALQRLEIYARRRSANVDFGRNRNWRCCEAVCLLKVYHAGCAAESETSRGLQIARMIPAKAHPTN
jgi:hypothetical protein